MVVRKGVGKDSFILTGSQERTTARGGTDLAKKVQERRSRSWLRVSTWSSPPWPPRAPRTASLVIRFSAFKLLRTMASLLFTLGLAVVFLAGFGSASLDDFCTDVSYFDVVKYTTTKKQCCETNLKQVCLPKSDTVCRDVCDLQCEVRAWADCKSTPSSSQSKKCSVEYKDYELKDCKEVKTSTTHTKQVPDCKKVTKNNCVTDWEIDAKGNKVWTGSETCTPVTWEECTIVDKQVEFPSVKTDCSVVGTIKWSDFVEKNKDITGLETTCEMKSAVDCKHGQVKKCASVSWEECRMEPVDECEDAFVHEPSQEKVHKKKCLTD